MARARSHFLIRKFHKRQWVALPMMVCVALGNVALAGTSRLYSPSDGESGGLRLTQVVAVATREQILRSGQTLQHLLASGLKDADLKDGSLAMGRIYCCHPSTEEGTAIWFYVPPNVQAQPGDLLTVRMGRKESKQDPGAVNTAVEVRERKNAQNSQCSWDPPDEKMWTRVLYCTWMPAEGWKLQNGLHKTWLKPASNGQ